MGTGTGSKGARAHTAAQQGGRHRQQAAGSRKQAAGSRQQAAGSRQQAAGSRRSVGTHQRCTTVFFFFSTFSHSMRTLPLFTKSLAVDSCMTEI